VPTERAAQLTEVSISGLSRVPLRFVVLLNPFDRQGRAALIQPEP
jgi:hypothetical protein